MNLPILYEDTDVLAINKPAGLIVHGASDLPSDKPTLAGWLAEHYPDMKNVGKTDEGDLEHGGDGPQIERGGIVHRLDRDTSGVILVAKTEKGFKTLKRQFKERTIIKHYHVFVYGTFREPRGMIDRPIGRSKNDFRKRSAGRGLRGEARDAVTIYRVLGVHGDVSFVEAIPKTGRTHQIRVHFKAISHPVVADSLYAASKPTALGFKRLALHAKEITFKNTQSQVVTVEAPYPDDFLNAIKEIGLPS